MGRHSSVNKLPIDLQLALNQSIRERGYGAVEEHAEWLAEKGHKVSKSAIHRHCQAMRAAESSLGDPRARAAEIRARPRGTREDLLIELGRLQLAQTRVIAQLQALDDFGMDTAGKERDDALTESVD